MAPVKVKEAAMVRNALDLLERQLASMADAEHAFHDALLDMSGQVTDADLARLLRDQAEQALVHVDRLEQAFDAVERPVGRRPNPAARGIVEDYVALTREDGAARQVRDVAAASTAFAAAHWGMAAYRALSVVARFEGADEALEIIDETMREEHEMAASLEQTIGRVVDTLAERDVEGTLRQAAMSLARETGTGAGMREPQRAPAGRSPRQAAGARTGTKTRGRKKAK